MGDSAPRRVTQLAGAVTRLVKFVAALANGVTQTTSRVAQLAV